PAMRTTLSPRTRTAGDARDPGTKTSQTSLRESVNMARTDCRRRAGGTAMRLGLHYWTYSTPPDPTRIADTLAETAKVAEQAGFSTFTVMDHYFQMEHAGPAGQTQREGCAPLAHLRAR